MTTSDYILSQLEAKNHPDNPWQWFAVRYRRPGSRWDETCFQMHLSEQQAIDYVAEKNPNWQVRGTAARLRLISPHHEENELTQLQQTVYGLIALGGPVVYLLVVLWIAGRWKR